MSNIEKFNETVSILVKAYLNDTLQHGNCFACAVGNIIAAKSGFKFCDKKVKGHSLSWEGQPYPAFNENAYDAQGWGAAFTTGFLGIQHLRLEYLTNEHVSRQIKISGYTWQELAKIENAFEVAPHDYSDRMFNGLMAVVDVLAEIHGIDLQQKESAKLMFAK